MKHLLLLIAVGLLAGCAEQTTEQPSMRALGQSIKVQETRSDEMIGTDVRRQLDLVGAAETSGVIVEVNDGVVTLRGVAPNVAAAWRAQAAARSVKSVKQVINQILIGN